ncbi:MAG: TIGR02221 family CRISPR-associated protein [Burkholderiaceae bacterium]
MPTLISFLGQSRSDPVTGYQQARYRFAPDFACDVPYFGMGLLEYLHPHCKKLILMGTPGSMWDVFFDHQNRDSNAAELMAAVEAQDVSPEALARHEQKLTQTLGIEVKCLLIPYAKDAEEQSMILKRMAESVQDGENIVLDVTHSFRHLPMLALVAARYLTHVRKVSVGEIYYGAFHMKDPDTHEVPVLKLGHLLKMLDWSEALAIYDQSGDYGVFASLLHDDGMDEASARMLSRGAYYERCNNPVLARESLSSALGAIDQHKGTLGQLFRTALTQRISWFRKGRRADWELALSDRYLEKRDYLRTLIYMFESLASHAVHSEGGNANDYDSRAVALKRIRDKRSSIKSLTSLRNTMVHGVRPTERSKNDERILRDETLLRERLQTLRRSLFNSRHRPLKS